MDKFVLRINTTMLYSQYIEERCDVYQIIDAILTYATRGVPRVEGQTH